MSFLEEVSDQLNVRWAWEKVRREASPGDIWFDEVELAGFELELERNLRSIGRALRKGDYRLAPIMPLPFPKHSDHDGKARLRQAFKIDVRDQVAWAALVNIVGPYVDAKMPAWSYGNRLYRPIWVEKDSEGVNRRKIGNYRHSSGQLFLSFGQSWPIFRRHVYLTTRAMSVAKDLPAMDERTNEEAELQERATEDWRCQFVRRQYWQNRRPSETNCDLYWCSIDLEKFYPSVNLETVITNITDQIPFDWVTDATGLLRSMLVFPLNTVGWSASGLNDIDIPKEERSSSRFQHVPTGLYVAGFLANAALLKVDSQVEKKLETTRVAHFRFVDDHICLAFSLDDLLDWVQKYKELLQSCETGTSVNLEKTSPKETGRLLADVTRRDEDPSRRKAAEMASRLDPQFPSPLMTKTLEVVSNIARTDFNLLDTRELAAMSDQLEHLLLVDLSEEELPVKTRLSFAATRLTLIAETQLAKDESRVLQSCNLEKLKNKLTTEEAKKEVDEERCRPIRDEIEILETGIRADHKRLTREMSRAFQLLRKVLRERPDRVRLWTRAVLMCRLTGVPGLSQLRDDIAELAKAGRLHRLAADYLYAHVIALVGSQSVAVAQVLTEGNAPQWRKIAAKAFLHDVCETQFANPSGNRSPEYVRKCWEQYCFGVYCANLLLSQGGIEGRLRVSFQLPAGALSSGGAIVQQGTAGQSAAAWAWWASRMTLRDLKSRASTLAKGLGRELAPSRATTAYWSFFPLDVPEYILRSMLPGHGSSTLRSVSSGWWIDALRTRLNHQELLSSPEFEGVPSCVRRVLTPKNPSVVSLFEWCEFLRRKSDKNTTDPRCGEWTALQIVKQIGELIDTSRKLTAQYINDVRGSSASLPHLHPANFVVPREWIEISGEPMWAQWKAICGGDDRTKGVRYTPQKDRIVDSRYTPIGPESRVSSAANPVRGLGLLLYGLLRKTFDLPAMWNGAGHAEMLGMLPKLLLTEVTSSSWTLGILQGCLQARAIENLFLRGATLVQWHADEDTLRDPVIFIGARDVVCAVQRAQQILEVYQLSTLEHRARQLTPIDIHQLTNPDWSKVFPDAASEGVVH